MAALSQTLATVASFDRESLSRLRVRQTSVCSARTLKKERSENRRNPRAALICPSAGSTDEVLLIRCLVAAPFGDNHLSVLIYDNLAL